LRNSHDQQLTQDEVEEIRKQSALQEAEGMTATYSNLTERLGMDEATKKLLYEKQTAVTMR